MMYRIWLCLILLSFTVRAQTGSGHLEYLWPTEASKYLTSAFGEYRARRFHAGIDIRTFGKVGFKCFAVRSGYVWRISVSPYGYGKSLYLKLDTGEIAVYAHLSKYNDKIESLIEAEQKRTGKYRVNIFLKENVVPVAQGEVIAYTGQTGIGAPHLHFEIRDSANRPTNPLLKGYELPDDVSPIIRKISFTPLGANSEINGDYRPAILTPKWLKSGEYFIPEPISMWGDVGIAVSSYDKSGNSSSRYGVYSLALYVDESLRFQYSYDRIDFQNNPMVELERDYRLARRNHGRFYKLYKDRYNVLNHYTPNKTWSGVLRSASLTATPTLSEQNDSQSKPELGTGALFPGIHEFRIEVTDFFGNLSVLNGKIQVGASFDIEPVLTETEQGELSLENVITYDLNRVQELDTHIYRNRRWHQLAFDWPDADDASGEKGGEGAFDESYGTSPGGTFLPTPASVNPLILRFDSRDQFGANSYPYYYVRSRGNYGSIPPEVEVDYDFYDNYVRLELTTNNILKGRPVVTLYPGRWDNSTIAMHQTSLKSFVGRIELKALNGSKHPLLVRVQNLDGEQYSFSEAFEAIKVRPKTSDRVDSSDKKLWVNFWSNSLFDPIYLRIDMDTSTALRDLDVVGQIYDVSPGDVLLRKGAFVHMQYPESTERPEHLGIYYWTGRGKWVFIDNRHDVSARSISAKVLSFEKFALIRDDEPPVISRIRPANNVRIRNSRPQISVSVLDKLSGIASEVDLEIRLDGKRLIAAYDPERERLIHRVQEPLSRGRHDLTIMAIDKSRNVAMKESSFWVE